MPIHYKELGLKELTYTFIDDDGKNIFIASERLRRWCLDNRSKLAVEWTPVDVKLAKSFLKENVVSPERLKQMTVLNLEDPAIFAKDGGYTNGAPDVMLVDGHHRYTYSAMIKRDLIKSWILELNQWKPFEVVGLGDFYTQEQLRNQPVFKKDYWKR